MLQIPHSLISAFPCYEGFFLTIRMSCGLRYRQSNETPADCGRMCWGLAEATPAGDIPGGSSGAWLPKSCGSGYGTPPHHSVLSESLQRRSDRRGSAEPGFRCPARDGTIHAAEYASNTGGHLLSLPCDHVQMLETTCNHGLTLPSVTYRNAYSLPPDASDPCR